MPLKLNTQAPDFSLPSTSGAKFRLSDDMAGKPLVLFFYPKDFTQVCTREACAFRDSFEVFKDLDIAVVGISRDPVETHLKFKEANQLPFELLSDASGKTCKAYQALVPVLNMPKRVTYLLDAKHKVAAVYENMFNANGHIRKMVEIVKQQAK